MYKTLTQKMRPHMPSFCFEVHIFQLDYWPLNMWVWDSNSCFTVTIIIGVLLAFLISLLNALAGVKSSIVRSLVKREIKQCPAKVFKT